MRWPIRESNAIWVLSQARVAWLSRHCCKFAPERGAGAAGGIPAGKDLRRKTVA